MNALQIAYRSPAQLLPHPRNAREHSDDQIDKIAASIRSFGFNSPVLVDVDDRIIACHGRVLAAIKLGLDRIPTVSIEHLSEPQRRAFMLADNRIAELSTWDEEGLALELEELSILDEPFEITDTGFELQQRPHGPRSLFHWPLGRRTGCKLGRERSARQLLVRRLRGS